MVQVGLNMGARHEHHLSWAKSFDTPKLSEGEKANQDEDVIGAASLLWNLIQANIPPEIAESINDKLIKINMPQLATRNVAQGQFYLTLSLGLS